MSLVLRAHYNMITLEGIETLVGLRALVSLDVTGCKEGEGVARRSMQIYNSTKVILAGFETKHVTG